jgi:hypothetical protein
VNRTGIIGRLDPFAILAFTLPLFIYLLTLAPSVTFFDSGEFITAVSSLGTAHSPGYPLFVNYAKPFTFLPFGSVAFRVNIATAVSAALACYGVYLLTAFLLKDQQLPGSAAVSRLAGRLLPLCAAVTFACTARLWLQSNHDKPYPLLAFICAVIFYLMLLWRESYLAGCERRSYVYLGAFLCGLGTGAHQIMVLMIPTYCYLLLSTDRRAILRVKEFLIAFAFGLLGFAIHLHLIVRALQKPLLNWGDSKNLTQFLWNMLRKGYPVDKPVRDFHLLVAQVNAFNVPYEFSYAGMALLIIGLAAFAARKRDVVLSYLIGIVSFLLVVAGYFNTPQDLIFLTEEFFTPLYLLSAVFIGLGLYFVVKEVAGALPASLSGNRKLGLCLLALPFILPAAICAGNYLENDQHENYIAYDYAANTLRTLPQGAVMYTWGDSGAFPLWYLQGVERMREDLDLPHTPHLVFDWYLDGFPGLFADSRLRGLAPEQLSAENALFISIAEQYPRRPVYVDFSTRYSVPFGAYLPHQRGICYRMDRAGLPLYPPDQDVWSLYTLRGIAGDSGMFFRDLDTGKAIQIYAIANLEAGESYLKLGLTGPGLAQLEQAKRIAPELGPQITQMLTSYGVRR